MKNQAIRKVLIADDEPHVSLVLRQFLERAGYQVDTVQNGEQALAQIKTECPDILITDVQMPKMNGIQLCEIIDQEMHALQMLKIMITSRTDSEIRTWLKSHPDIVLIEKPMSMRNLVILLNKYFETNQV